MPRLLFPANQGHDGVALHPQIAYAVIYDEFAPDGRSLRNLYVQSSLQGAIARFRKFINLLHLGGWKIKYMPEDGMYLCWKYSRRRGVIHARRIGVRASTLMIDSSKPLW